MTKVIYTARDGALAERIERDMQAAGLGDEDIAIVILSPETAGEVEAAIIRALDQGQRIIPALAAPTPLPGLIAHLEPLDFSAGYDFDALRARILAGGTPVKVRTPTLRTSNRRLGYVLVALAVLWFLIAVIFIAGGVIGRPDEEFDAVETQIVLTRNYFVDANLPRTTQEAAEFASTVQAVPTALRPILSATATAAAGE